MRTRGPSRPHRVERTARFDAAVLRLVKDCQCDHAILESVLAGVSWGLENGPTLWPAVPETIHMHVVTTRRTPKANGSVPGLRILYRINDDGTVDLLELRTYDLYL